MQRTSSVSHIFIITLMLTWGVSCGQLQVSIALMWLALMALTLGLVFPAVKKDEAAADVRSGAWRRMASDPFLFLGAAAVLFFVVQAVNGGRTLAYDAVRDQWAFSLPAWRHGPSSVVSDDAWLTAAHAFVIIAVCLALRHTVGKRGKVLLLHGMSLSAAALVLWLFVRGVLAGSLGCVGMPRFLFAADPAAVGAYYVLMTALSCGLALDAGVHGQFKAWLTIPAILNFMGFGVAGAPSAILVGWAFAGVGGLYAALYMWPSMPVSHKIRSWVLGIVPILAAGLSYFWFYKNNPVLRALQASGSWGAFFNGWVQGVEAAVHTAWRVWAESPWVGVGSGGFKHFAPLHGFPEFARADGHVGLDLVETLCEHGVVGCVLVTLAWGTILFGNVRRLALLRYLTSGSSTRHERSWIFRMMPMAAFLCLGTGLVFSLGAVGTVFRSPFVSFSWCIVVTCLGSFLPMRKAV